MKAYRYLTKEELDNLLDGNIDNLGREYDSATFSRVNNHKYKANEKYLHFYHNKEDIKYAQDIHKNDPAMYYICGFDIPALTLIKHKGYGLYDSHGYDNDRDKITEFAIPVREFKTDYLTSFQFDSEHYNDTHQTDRIPAMRFRTNMLDDGKVFE